VTRSIAIVGGGAAGIFAALGAAKAAREQNQAIEVHLFERNPRVGIKILISGGGKCNITHAGPVEEVLKLVFPYLNEQRFLKHALYRYTNEEVLRLLESHGVAWHARENGRIFPNSGRAEDVLSAFEAELRSARTMMHTKCRVESIVKDDMQWKLTTSCGEHLAGTVILTTGGTSYKKVGTTGDGINYAAKLGHAIVPLRAALAPIYLKFTPRQDLVGIALRDVELTASQDDKLIASKAGDILLTHRGISGPASLDLSREAALAAEEGPITIQVNLLRKMQESVSDLLIDLQSSRSQQHVKTWLDEILPNRFVPYILSQADLPIDRKWYAFTKEERTRLLSALTAYDFGEVREIPIDRGEVTAGGVSLKEVDSKTMMSRLHPGLFFAGEMLDIAGEIGGYNLQAAYSTGWVAGTEAVSHLPQ
jgi:predicted Rossmann fold flavoprotein